MTYITLRMRQENEADCLDIPLSKGVLGVVETEKGEIKARGSAGRMNKE
jgi:hypothetical protein